MRYTLLMRAPLDRPRLERFLDALGQRARGGGRVYLVGGATAIWYGWRAATVDVDLRLDPEPPGAFEAIADLKDELDINVELASPADFLPEVPGWRERSLPVARFGPVEVLHYDPVSQALAKIARGHERDLADVRAMLAARLLQASDLAVAFERIIPGLIRYPALDERVLRGDLERFLASLREAQ